MASNQARAVCAKTLLSFVALAATACGGGGSFSGETAGVWAVPSQIAPNLIAASPHAALGLPEDGDPSDDYWMAKDDYVLSYNIEKKSANWVSWTLRAEDMGDVERSGRFRADPTVPPEGRVQANDYRGTGYDRGHLCPSRERTSTTNANAETFLMTNIQPQLHALNNGPWKSLEEEEQSWAESRGTVLHIIAGPVFGPNPARIGPDIAVPEASFRIVVRLARGEGLKDITERTEVVAVLMPNTRSVERRSWRELAVSIDAIEAATGYDFLADLPDQLEDAIEAR